MRSTLVALTLLLTPLASAQASPHVGVSVGVAIPGLSIGLNVPSYPELVQVPGHPVYYDPRGDSNYFFSDGLYWVLSDDRWYSSEWYDGPWQLVTPEYVPSVVLRVPVRYYHRPPAYFAGWHRDRSPRWGSHWGTGWERHRSGWDRWDRHSAPRPAPLPVYQRQYAGDRYPRAWEQQRAIHADHSRGRGHDDFRSNGRSSDDRGRDRGVDRGGGRVDRGRDDRGGDDRGRDDRRGDRGRDDRGGDRGRDDRGGDDRGNGRGRDHDDGHRGGRR